MDAGKAMKGWQTTAWSGGNIDSRISLYQYAYDVSIAGGSCDLDYGYGEDLGQWSTNPPDTTHATINEFDVTPVRAQQEQFHDLLQGFRHPVART